MTAELANAIRKLDWIVVTGWVPHWKFARYRLKFLDDPEKVYGGEETIHTLVREGLKEDMPEIYAFLEIFTGHRRTWSSLCCGSKPGRAYIPRTAHVGG